MTFRKKIKYCLHDWKSAVLRHGESFNRINCNCVHFIQNSSAQLFDFGCGDFDHFLCVSSNARVDEQNSQTPGRTGSCCGRRWELDNLAVAHHGCVQTGWFAVDESFCLRRHWKWKIKKK